MGNKIERNIYTNKVKRGQINGETTLKILKNENKNRDIRNLRNNSLKEES